MSILKKILNREKEAVFDFRGGIIGLSGAHKGKILLLAENQSLDIVLAENGKIKICIDSGDADCLIVYDEINEEYHVVSYLKSFIFLKSGQPLGKGRLYILPRGKEVYFSGRENCYQLV